MNRYNPNHVPCPAYRAEGVRLAALAECEDADAAAERQHCILRAQTLGELLDAIEESDRELWDKLDELLWGLCQRLAEAATKEAADEAATSRAEARHDC